MAAFGPCAGVDDLGRTGLKVSRLALGTMNFGEFTDEPSSFAIMDEALDSGINLWDIATAQCSASARHLLGLASEQSLYNLSQRTIELGVIPALRHYGVGLIPWSPIGMGLLGGVLAKLKEGRRASDMLRARVEKARPQLEAYEALCSELGQPPAVVALAWVLHQPVVTAAISGPRTADQLRESLKASSLVLSAETLKGLDEIWPGPGGEAPMAYAW
jgi:aryl-alcohol dehydrogenase-like predicted oxidoreductase